MLFSIIIPTYNRAALISITLQSVLIQTYPNFEIIIVDDGSTDNTEDVVKAIVDKRIAYFKKNNEERAIARNYGTLKAKGDYITFLDSDDILCPHFFNEAIKMIEGEKQPAWFHLRYIIKDGKDRTIVNEYDIYKKQDPNKRLFYEGNFISCIGVFLRKDIALVNLFSIDRALTISEDHELWLRVAAQYPLKINNIVCASLIQHDYRSITTLKKEILINSKELALQLTLSNPLNINFIKGHERYIKSSTYSYISLHLALTGKCKKICLFYLIKALQENYLIVFSKRFLAIIKHLLLTY